MASGDLVTLDELEAAYNRINKSWSSLSRSNKSIAVRQLIDYEAEARDLGGGNLAAALHLLAGRIQIELDGALPAANEDPGLEY